MSDKSTAHKGLPGQEMTEKKEVADKLNSTKEQVREQIIERHMKESGMSRQEAEEAADSAIAKERRVDTREFDHDFFKLYMNDPFIGAISAEVTKIADYDMPTAYVGIRNHNGRRHEVVMGYNPDFFRSLSPSQRQGVIKHEMYHLIFQHIFDRAPADKDYQILWNWACDLATNSIIGEKNLPDACLIPGKAPIDPATGKEIRGPYADFIAKAPKMESSDFYFEKLREIEEQQRKNGNSNSITVAIGQGMDSIDDHGKWGDLPEEVKGQIRDKVHDLLEKAVKRAERTNDWGSVPAQIADVIRRILSREIDWRSILRQFIGRSRSMERNSTIKRLNKKAPYLFPGHKRKYMANFACFIDQSGSMSNEDIAMLFSELESLAGLTDLDVYHFDTEVDEQSHTLWKKGRPFPPAHRTRCGGTDFDCVRNFVNRPENRGKWSGIIMLTDGYAPTMGQIIGTRVIWVVTEHGTMDAIRRGDLAVQMKKEKRFKRY